MSTQAARIDAYPHTRGARTRVRVGNPPRFRPVKQSNHVVVDSLSLLIFAVLSSPLLALAIYGLTR
jgi:hypothetical protein